MDDAALVCWQELYIIVIADLFISIYGPWLVPCVAFGRASHCFCASRSHAHIVHV